MSCSPATECREACSKMLGNRIGTLYRQNIDKQEPRILTMALSIKDPETEKLARTLAERTGETITVATRRAIEDRLRRVGADAAKAALIEDMEAIRRRLAALPVLDPRSMDDILGYDENGLPV